MIIEFFGLPGAGKTSLELALVEILQSQNLTIISRDETVSDFIAAWSGIPRAEQTLLSRACSAMYKSLLLQRAVFGKPSLLQVSDIAQPHIIRTATRVAENLQLYPWIRTQATNQRATVLCEGIAQHLIAYSAWRRLLSANQAIPALGSLLLPLLARDCVLVHVDLPQQEARRRLEKRGTPPLWPKTVATGAIQDAFAAATVDLIDTLSAEPNHTLVTVDASNASADWQAEARSVARTIEALA